MISKSYKENKEQVLALYDEYVEMCKSTEKKVDKSIEEQAKKIKNEIFNLMVLGEAKSGKSTFINAYLGKEVVPMDVRQCTSAIIKIHKGDKFKLIAKTAAGGKIVITKENEIYEFLKDNAAIPDDYRSIPVTTINNELLIKYKGRVPSHIIKSFCEEVQEDNIFNMNIEQYNELISKYISEKKNDWGKIVTEIEITYNLPNEMKGITIIDSPGVSAGGNVGKIAEEYIKDANAIIFVKSLNGQALESSSFMNFLRHNCTNRKKESLFLVLTGKSNLQGSEFTSLKEQAIDIYQNDIDKEKIIFVDSKIQLFLNKCHELETEENIDKFFDELDKNGNDFAPASKCWLKSKGNINIFQEKMRDLSNFDNVNTSLERFSRIANYIQLIQFIENIEKECKRYEGIYSDTLKVVKENIEDPTALEDKVKKKKKEINRVYNKINDGIQEIRKKYTDNISGEGLILNEVEKLKLNYEAELQEFRNISESKISETTFSSMKKKTMDTMDNIKAFRREIANRIIKECNDKLIYYLDDSYKIPVEVYIPNFTISDFESIDNYAKEKTSGYNDIESGLTFKSTERVPYHQLKKHVNLVADSIYDRLDGDIIPKLQKNLMKYFEECINLYSTKLDEHSRELEFEYDKLLRDKDDNEKKIINVENLEKNLTKIKNEEEKIILLKGELNNYVER